MPEHNGKKTVKSAVVRKAQDKIRAVRKKLKFRGRFGKKNIRRKSNPKWQKWRKPRGIDIKRKKEDGILPKPGYGTMKEIRGLHPSGMKEKIVRNEKELGAIEKGCAARISAGVGERKRAKICEAAEKEGIKILNP